ncbi:UbiA family prenyltransferase [Mucilaginibacter sp. dw_454]|uniref:UbiA family prenyltransferase n=1 Tax=Mucilaginibacter sp. dw_454 TaxID=2720079 RepID=UPI001BD45FC5|nr:UbiA family prenyltransferase [Mucilaginibacter sp. dw_454]
MKKLYNSVFDFILFSNVFIALCAVAQGAVTFYLIGAKPVYTVSALLFTSTIGIYNLSILLYKPQLTNSENRRTRWFFSHHRLMVTFTIVSALSLVPLFFLVSTPSKLLLIFLGLISVAYSLPLFTLGDQKFGLRNIPGLKQFLITLVWTMSIVLLPILEAQDMHLTNITMRDTTLLLAKRFLFIGALTIPFDIRDLFEDRESGLKTVPVVVGEKRAYLFCQFLLAGYVILLFLYRNSGFNANFFALTSTALLAGWLIFKSKWKRNEYYYFFYLDGVLILQYIFLLALNYALPK